ncbi:MAG: asparagine synthase (glutamine-hydrolyzing) [Bacteroidia bacterium]
MCGIAGFIDAKWSTEQGEQLLIKMLAATVHRGPDYTGKYIDSPVYLGHNRLSIIDLSDNANQPMHFENLSIVYNGEIYNYLEIKEELQKKGYHFKTQSDTEVILVAYKEWGENCVNYFVGMWAFVIWDSQKKELFASRDRFGIKPFYYISHSGAFYFSSEYKGLKPIPYFKNTINVNQAARGLQLGWMCYQDESYFECIKILPAAHNLRYKDSSIEIAKYWDIKDFRTTTLSYHEKVELFRDKFINSVNLHMRSDVEVGACLSGGIDSSSIVSVLGKKYPDSKIKTFTIYYDGKNEVDERPWVNEVIKKFPHIDNFSYSPKEDEIREYFDKTLYYADVPIASSSPVSQYAVMKLVSEHQIKVVLDGQGSDEYLAGYAHSYYRLLADKLASLNIGGALSVLNKYVAEQQFSFTKKLNIFSKSILASIMSENALYHLEFEKYYPNVFTKPLKNIFNISEVRGANHLNAFLYHLLFTTSLPNLLHYEDRNSMAFSIESRVPFLDHRLVEQIFTYANEDKIDGAITKKVLRDSLKDYLPEAIYNRTDKKGFVTPGEIKWLRGSLKHLIEQPLKIDFIDTAKAKVEIEKFKRGDNTNALWVWRLVVLNEWIKKL